MLCIICLRHHYISGSSAHIKISVRLWLTQGLGFSYNKNTWLQCRNRRKPESLFSQQESLKYSRSFSTAFLFQFKFWSNQKMIKSSYYYFQPVPLGIATADHLPPSYPTPTEMSSFDIHLHLCVFSVVFLFHGSLIVQHPKSRIPTFKHVHLSLACKPLNLSLSFWYARFHPVAVRNCKNIHHNRSRYLIVTLPFHLCCYCHPLHPTWLDVRRSLSQSDLYSCCFPCVSFQALPAHYNYFWFLLLKRSKRKHNKHNVIQMSNNKTINQTVHQEPTIYWCLNWKHFDLFIRNTCAGNAIDTGPHQKDD